MIFDWYWIGKPVHWAKWKWPNACYFCFFFFIVPRRRLMCRESGNYRKNNIETLKEVLDVRSSSNYFHTSDNFFGIYSQSFGTYSNLISVFSILVDKNYEKCPNFASIYDKINGLLDFCFVEKKTGEMMKMNRSHLYGTRCFPKCRYTKSNRTHSFIHKSCSININIYMYCRWTLFTTVFVLIVFFCSSFFSSPFLLLARFDIIDIN